MWRRGCSTSCKPRLLGSDVTLIGVRPEVAQALVALGLNLPDLRTVRDLHSALAA